MNIILGVLGIIILVGIGYFLSENRKAIKWKPVIVGLVAQLVVILFVLKIPIGVKMLDGVSNFVLKILSFGNVGLQFVFGDSVNTSFVFAVNVLCLICFTSAIISVLYYLRVIPFLVKYLGKGIAKIMGTTPVETFCSVGNSFLGATEAPLLTKPFLRKLTRSELFAVVVGGFASVSVSVIGGYVAMGIDIKYLLIAMATVPFSTLLISKLIIPETEESESIEIDVTKSDDGSLVEAISSGALSGMQLALAVGAVLIAFLGVMALVNWGLGFIGTSVEQIVGFIFIPVAWLFNIPAHEMQTFSEIIGMKTAANEFIAFSNLGQAITTLTPRTQAILSVALNNFANFSVIAITISGFKTFCPEKVKTVSGFGLKAMIAATLTTLITSAIVGILF